MDPAGLLRHDKAAYTPPPLQVLRSKPPLYPVQPSSRCLHTSAGRGGPAGPSPASTLQQHGGSGALPPSVVPPEPPPSCSTYSSSTFTIQDLMQELSRSVVMSQQQHRAEAGGPSHPQPHPRAASIPHRHDAAATAAKGGRVGGAGNTRMPKPPSEPAAGNSARGPAAGGCSGSNGGSSQSGRDTLRWEGGGDVVLQLWHTVCAGPAEGIKRQLQLCGGVGASGSSSGLGGRGFSGGRGLGELGGMGLGGLWAVAAAGGGAAAAAAKAGPGGSSAASTAAGVPWSGCSHRVTKVRPGPAYRTLEQLLGKLLRRAATPGQPPAASLGGAMPAPAPIGHLRLRRPGRPARHLPVPDPALAPAPAPAPGSLVNSAAVKQEVLGVAAPRSVYRRKPLKVTRCFWKSAGPQVVPPGPPTAADPAPSAQLCPPPPPRAQEGCQAGEEGRQRVRGAGAGAPAHSWVWIWVLSGCS